MLFITKDGKINAIQEKIGSLIYRGYAWVLSIFSYYVNSYQWSRIVSCFSFFYEKTKGYKHTKNSTKFQPENYLHVSLWEGSTLHFAPRCVTVLLSSCNLVSYAPQRVLTV